MAADGNGKKKGEDRRQEDRPHVEVPMPDKRDIGEAAEESDVGEGDPPTSNKPAPED